MDGVNFFIRAQGSKFWGKWGSEIKRQEDRDQWVPDILCYDSEKNLDDFVKNESNSTKSLKNWTKSSCKFHVNEP